MPLRLWFNQAYRGTYQLIGMLRAGAARDGLRLHVTGSHTVASTPFLQACDDAFPEPEQLTGDAWVEHALAVCRDRGIEVFVPGRERLAVAEAQDAFSAAGVRVMVSPPEALRVLGDKALAHVSALQLGIPVPRTHVVTDADGFRRAYDELRARGLGVCMKPAVDHGAAGFRVLDETVGGWDDLLALPSPRVHPDEVERRMAARGTVAPLLVAEHLDGDEISVDVLSRDGALLAAVPRGKGGPQWTRQIVDDPAALAIAEAVVKGHGLRYLSNVQVRYGSGTCRLLEVNTRAASGLFHSAAAGVDLPYAALRLLLDGDVTVPPPTYGATVLTYTEAREIALPFRTVERNPVTERAQEWRLVRRPDGYPVPEDVELVEVDVPTPRPGEVLVRNTYVSVDPYMRGRMNAAASYAAPYQEGKAMWGGAVGTVAASSDERFPVGTAVRHGKGWRTHATVRTSDLERIAEAGPAYLGVLGMPGLTAWVGLFDIAEVRPGETVWVSAASGAVGSLAGQLARLAGCRVIGSAGGAEKARGLVDTLGFHAGLDHRAGDLEGQLRAAAPEGIDVYFENVGGEHLRAALATLNPFGRIAACGMISDYNDTRPGPDNLFLVVGKKLTMRGYIVSDHAHRAAAFERHVAPLLREGRIVYPETVVEGIEQTFDAFVGMLRGGSHTGKLVVRV